MSGAAEKIAEKISSYDLINNLIPGAVYVSIVERTTAFELGADNLIAQAVLYYFAGTVIGRIGSLCVEQKLIGRTSGVETVPYADFTRAEKLDKDGKITVLSAVNNMYRTFVSVSLCILLTVLADIAWSWLPKCEWTIQAFTMAGSIALAAIFAKSYKKQTGYVVSRVKTVLNEAGEDNHSALDSRQMKGHMTKD